MVPLEIVYVSVEEFQRIDAEYRKRDLDRFKQDPSIPMPRFLDISSIKNFKIHWPDME